MRTLYWATALACTALFQARAQQLPPSIEICSLAFWDNVTTAQDIALGTPADRIQNPNAKAIAGIVQEKGAAFALMTIKGQYADCSRRLNIDLRASHTPKDAQFINCSYLSALRYNVLVRLEQGESEDALKASIPARFHDTISVLARMNRTEGFAKAVAFSAQTGRECVAQVRSRFR
jgi:hypothetical protein